MLHDLADQLSVLDVTPELLRDRALGVIAILVFRRQVDVDARALAGEDFRVRAVLRQVDLGRINLVQQDCGYGAEDLEGEIGAFNDVYRADERVDDEGCACAVVD